MHLQSEQGVLENIACGRAEQHVVWDCLNSIEKNYFHCSCFHLLVYLADLKGCESSSTLLFRVLCILLQSSKRAPEDAAESTHCRDDRDSDKLEFITSAILSSGQAVTSTAIISITLLSSYTISSLEYSFFVRQRILPVSPPNNSFSMS